MKLNPIILDPAEHLCPYMVCVAGTTAIRDPGIITHLVVVGEGAGIAEDEEVTRVVVLTEDEEATGAVVLTVGEYNEMETTVALDVVEECIEDVATGRKRSWCHM